MQTKDQTIHSQIQNQSIGKLLSSARAERGLSLAQVSAATKIRQEFIVALEGGYYHVFASDVYAKGFLKNYAKFLNLDTDQVLALYRREQKPTITKHRDLHLNSKTDSNLVEKLLTRRMITLVSVGLIIFLAVFYAVNQVNSLLRAPSLSISEPVALTSEFDGEVLVSGNSFKILGHTLSQSIVRLNAEPIPIDADGSFSSTEIPLKDSQSVLILTSTNQFGRTATIKLHVKKGGTSVVTTTKMSVLIEIKNDATPLIARTDGEIKFNDRAFPGDVISLTATSRFQIETETPTNISVNINGAVQPLTVGNQTWELIDGKVVSK